MPLCSEVMSGNAHVQPPQPPKTQDARAMIRTTARTINRILPNLPPRLAPPVAPAPPRVLNTFCPCVSCCSVNWLCVFCVFWLCELWFCAPPNIEKILPLGALLPVGFAPPCVFLP